MILGILLSTYYADILSIDDWLGLLLASLPFVRTFIKCNYMKQEIPAPFRYPAGSIYNGADLLSACQKIDFAGTFYDSVIANADAFLKIFFCVEGSLDDPIWQGRDVRV